MGSQQETVFQIKDRTIDASRPLKVRIIGAGFSGIYLAIRIPQKLRNIDLKILEKNDGIGGTWWENRYPGCACDIPAHSYQYTFEPNPNWSSFYAPAKEICQYLTNVAEKCEVNRFVNLSHNVTGCIWDEKDKKWRLTISKVGKSESFEDEADVLIVARGGLNNISWPSIPGLKSFKGEVMHSAAWNEKYDFTNKKIGVIGGGSSAIQIVPQLQKVPCAHLTCFVRSKTWISNPFGDSSMVKLGLDPNELAFSDEQRKVFASNPEEYLQFRKIIEADGNTMHPLFYRGSEMQGGALAAFKSIMEQRLQKRPEIAKALVLSFSVGCRRLTPGPGYLEALSEDNVDFVVENICSISPEGLLLENGKTVDLDVLVCATGFKTKSPPPFPVIGKNGLTMEERYTPFPETYLSVAVDGFPNHFMMLGNNGGAGSGSLTAIMESQGDFIVKCLRKLQKEDYISMVPKRERVKDFCQYIDNYFQKTVFMDQCNSWYRADIDGKSRVTALWPGTSLHELEALRSPRWEDFEYESADKNLFRWFGNGTSITNFPELADPAWYLEPSQISRPTPGKPEDSDEFKGRPFSH